jgi:hypothetical protein
VRCVDIRPRKKGCGHRQKNIAGGVKALEESVFGQCPHLANLLHLDFESAHPSRANTLAGSSNPAPQSMQHCYIRPASRYAEKKLDPSTIERQAGLGVEQNCHHS